MEFLVRIELSEDCVAYLLSEVHDNVHSVLYQHDTTIVSSSETTLYETAWKLMKLHLMNTGFQYRGLPPYPSSNPNKLFPRLWIKPVSTVTPLDIDPMLPVITICTLVVRRKNTEETRGELFAAS